MPWNLFGFRTVCHSQNLKKELENSFGCDSIFVIKMGADVKIGLFEAKFPRLSKTKYRWDYEQKKNSLPLTPSESHFSNQLERQHKWINDAAIWELFITEGKPLSEPPYFDMYASTCIWHNITHKFRTKHLPINTIWTSSNLKKLMEINHRLNYLADQNLFHMLMRVFICEAGNRLKIDSEGYTYLSKNIGDNFPAKIPVDLNILNGNAVMDFCSSFNFANFLYIELE